MVPITILLLNQYQFRAIQVVAGTIILLLIQFQVAVVQVVDNLPRSTTAPPLILPEQGGGLNYF